MAGIETLLRRLRALLRRAELEREMDEELRTHVEMEREELSRHGLSAEEARRQALVAFGGVERTKEDAREARGFPWLEDLAQDVRYAVRGLARTPGFTAAVVVTLALAIGANATMFGIVDRLLLRGPEHVRDAGRVRRVYSRNSSARGGPARLWGHFGYVTYTDLREGAAGLFRVAAYGYRDMGSGQGPDARTVSVGSVTWDFFPLLGIEPTLGRFFRADEDRPPRGERVAVLDNRFWRRQYGGDPRVIGRQIDLRGAGYTVVGVAPPGFTGVDLRPVDVWLPMSTRPNPTDWPTTRVSQFLRIIARLKPGVGAEQAAAAATLVHRRAMAGTPPFDSARIEFLPILRGEAGEERAEASVSRWLVGVAAIVLLVACANVANLLLARATRRKREVAVRLALGAGRLRLVRLLMAESVALALAGGVAALAVAYWVGPLLRTLLLPDVAFGRWPIDWRVLSFTALAALGTGILAGLVPALEASRPDLSASLKAVSLHGGTARSGFSSAVVAGQSALAFVLLVGAALFVTSLRRTGAVDLGVEPGRVLVVPSIAWPSLSGVAPGEAAAERSRHRAVFDEALERLRARPWVEHASASIGTPFEYSIDVSLRVPGLDLIPELPGGGPFVSAVSPDYFATVGTALVRGRGFTPVDRAGSERVVVVNEAMARALWPGQEALGRCVVVFNDSLPCARVVGVVRNAHQWQLQELPAMQCYVPLGQEVGIDGLELLVRPRGPHPERAVELVRREFWAIQPDLPYADVRLLEEALGGEVRPWRLGASLFSAFGLLALVVTVVGLYSVIAYVVEQRNREYAVRIALGARPGDVFGQTLRRGLAPAAIGLPLGVVIVLLAGRFLEPLLFETSARDVRILALVALTLLAVSALASLIPAIRATRVDPVVALQAE